MRRFIRKTAGWIHTTLIMTIITPLLYSFGTKGPDATLQNLYFKCLVIALPIVATDFAVKKCKGLLSYLAVSTFILAVTASIGWLLTASLHRNLIFWIYMAVLSGETVYVIVIRISDRVRKKREAYTLEGTNPTWQPTFDSLSTPNFSTLIYFVSVYLIAVNLNNSAVCNAALFSAIVYTLITFLYHHICETEKYIALNKTACNIPSKRIYGIGNGMMAIFLLLFVIMILPALFTISNRHYRDLRDTTIPINIDYAQIMEEYEMQNADPDTMEMLMEQLGETKPLPEWVNTLFNMIAAAVFLFLVGSLIKFIYNTFRTFRGINDENGDVVEELQEIDEGVKIRKAHVSSRKLPERERIRREYRRFIRKYRKERPARYESPTEIERNAGIAENEETKELHRQYELARYGPEIRNISRR